MAKEDSPDTYAELCLGGVKEKLDECVSTKGAPFRVAELFVLKYGDIIRCVSAKKQAFYAFCQPSVDGKWQFTAEQHAFERNL